MRYRYVKNGKITGNAPRDAQLRSSATRPRHPSSGMSLLELLVVIAIVGLLIALLLPAVQNARESARRVQCQNNLHQIGIAFQNYHDAVNTLPPGCLQWRPFGGSPNLKNFAWSALLLPFVEKAQLQQRIDFNHPFDHPINASAAGNPVLLYQCPSASQRESQRGRSDYAGLYGQRITVRNRTNNGVLIYDRCFSFRDITDGLTNTLIVAEDALGPDAEWINGSNVLEQSGAINDRNGWIGDNEIRSRHPGGAMALYSCGRVRFLTDQLEPNVLAAMITRADGDLFQEDLP